MPYDGGAQPWQQTDAGAGGMRWDDLMAHKQTQDAKILADYGLTQADLSTSFASDDPRRDAANAYKNLRNTYDIGGQQTFGASGRNELLYTAPSDRAGFRENIRLGDDGKGGLTRTPEYVDQATTGFEKLVLAGIAAMAGGALLGAGGAGAEATAATETTGGNVSFFDDLYETASGSVTDASSLDSLASDAVTTGDEFANETAKLLQQAAGDSTLSTNLETLNLGTDSALSEYANESAKFVQQQTLADSGVDLLNTSLPTIDLSLASELASSWSLPRIPSFPGGGSGTGLPRTTRPVNHDGGDSITRIIDRIVTGFTGGGYTESGTHSGYTPGYTPGHTTGPGTVVLRPGSGDDLGPYYDPRMPRRVTPAPTKTNLFTDSTLLMAIGLIAVVALVKH